MIIGLALIAYILGSIPFGLWVGKWGYGIDIREHGSGNLGATNSFRILGVKAGIIVTLGDILKGTAATSLPHWFSADVHPLIIGVIAVIGHIFPLFARFKGGKAVATTAGVLLWYDPTLFLVGIACFVLLLIITRYVSISSSIAGVCALIYTFFTQDVVLMVVIALLVSFILYRHRQNFKRVLEKTEPKVNFKRNNKKQYG
ncbi:glycerol-3-phosphate acyltransferase [Priestia megaterium]|nr:glycerol-3-phosphate acyltransferase [Priestia megaterium]